MLAVGPADTADHAAGKPWTARRLPHPMPEPDPENARCCYRPAYAVRGRAKTAICITCTASAPKAAPRLLNGLPARPGVPCRHGAGQAALRIGWTECHACHGVLNRPPGEVVPLQPPSRTVQETLDEVRRSLRRAADPSPCWRRH